MIPGLDGLRAIAFLFVFGFHADYFPFGWTGVQMFFVFSGYLITGILLNMKEKMNAQKYFLIFYTRRFLRIFPLYYFYLFVVFLLSTWFISISFSEKAMRATINQLWYGALYVYNFYATHQSYNSSRFLDHLWSLSVEEQFYLLWPLIILFVNEKRLKQLFLAGVILGPFMRLVIFFVYQSGQIESLRDPVENTIYTLPFSYMDAFALGAYISRFNIPNARKQLLGFGLIFPLLGFAAQYATYGKFGPILTLGYEDAMPSAYKYIWGYTLISYWFTLLVYCVTREKMFVRFLEWAPLRYLGKISYGLYIYHFPVIWLVDQIHLLGISVRFTPLALLVMSFMLTVIIASISYYVVEQPFLKMKDRYASYSS